MYADQYQNEAMALEADQEAINDYRRSMSVEEQILAVRFDNGLTGLVDEVGELSAVKKRWLEYQKPLTEEIKLNGSYIQM